MSRREAPSDGPARAARQPAAVRAAGCDQRARRRDDRPGAHRPAVDRRARLRLTSSPPRSPSSWPSALVKAPTNFVAGTLSDRLRPQARPRGGVDRRDPGAVAADVGADVGLDHRRQRAPGDQPGTHLVDHGEHEDRPCRPGPARSGHGPERGRRVRRRRPHRDGDGLHRRTVRVATRALLPWRRLRRPRARALDPVRP